MQFSMTSPVSTWRVLGASVVGTSHRKKGLGCDDDHSYRFLDNGIVLLATADGAGSASYAAKGASYAVQASCNVAQHLFAQQTEPANKEEWHTVLSTVLQTVRVGLEKLVSSEIDPHINALNESLASNLKLENDGQQPPIVNAEGEVTGVGDTVGAALSFNVVKDAAREGQSVLKPVKLSLRDFATTLQLVIITSQWIAVAQVGDGAVVIQHANGEVETLTWPDHGEYINQASFITDSDYLAQAQYAAVPCSEIQGVALFTDGLERLALEFAAKKPYEPFFAPMFRFAANSDATQEELQQELAVYLESERICERTSDDKTLVLAVPLRREAESSDLAGDR